MRARATSGGKRTASERPNLSRLSHRSWFLRASSTRGECARRGGRAARGARALARGRGGA
eukprot:7129820-Prymnesium_polylepis.1